jgi:hypothetical protein
MKSLAHETASLCHYTLWVKASINLPSSHRLWFGVNLLRLVRVLVGQRLDVVDCRLWDRM